MQSAEKQVKVGILCMHQKCNYGARLLAWALQEKVKALLPEGAEVGLIQNTNHLEQKRFEGVKQSKNLSDLMQSGWRFANEQLKKIRNRLFNRRLDVTSERLRNIRFSAFDAQYLHLIGASNTAEEFKAIASGLDAMIVGSDIVFRPEYVKYYPDVYMLCCFSGERVKTKKLSYAAAIATDRADLLNPLKDDYARGLQNYDFISVRERYAQQFLQPLTEKPVRYCCDPVLLFTAEELDFVPHITEGKYIYANLLDRSKDSGKYLKKLAAEKGMKVQLFANAKMWKDEVIESVYSDGPLEFIDRIRSAEYVVTNSFHTVLFSLLFHKPFVVLAREDQSLKLRDILATVGLEDRIAADDMPVDIDRAINWEQVDQKLAQLRRESFDFLQTALQLQ